jgi:hypothetical protein
MIETLYITKNSKLAREPVSGNVCKKSGSKTRAQKSGKSSVPKNDRIPRPIFYHLIKLSAICAKLYLFALTNRRIPERQGHNRAYSFRTKTKLSHIVQVTGAHGYVVLKPRALIPVSV